jgi:uncharacterized cofD-like protein
VTGKTFNGLKWLWPGMRVKRWLLLTVFGVAMVVVGLAFFSKDSANNFFDMLNDIADAVLDWLHVDISRGELYVPIGATFILIGLSVIFLSFFLIVRSIIGALWPESGFKTGDIADKVYQRMTLGQGLRVVVVGGGTGLSTMLRGLKHETSNISAIVTVSDNGGSSGALTASTGILPPGDLRNCMVALADEEPTLARAFNYRFNGEHPEGLRGHSLGNLFIAAMAEINDGNYERAIADASKILAIRGRVYPSTLDRVTLIGELEGGQCVEGEVQIARSHKKIEHVWLRPENAQPLPDAIAAIEAADAIILGPGSVYTSIIPNLLVEGIADAIHKSRAKKMYVCNVMTEVGETDGFSASDHVAAIAAHAPGKRLFDFVLVNKQRPSAERLDFYKTYGQTFVEPDVEQIRALGYTPILGNFISHSEVVRHDANRLADTIRKQLI